MRLHFLMLTCAGVVLGSTLSVPAQPTPADVPAPTRMDPSVPPGQGILSADDEAFLEDIQKRGIAFFVDEQHPVTGLMPDRARADGGRSNDVASTASVGFGLTAICIAEQRGWMPREEAIERCSRVVNFLLDKMPHEHGHFYHFIEMSTGKRVWNCEVSNVDTALLMFGVITAKQHFAGTDLARRCQELFDRVEWGWLLDTDNQLFHGFRPEEGKLKAKWGGFSEGPPLIVLLGLGSATHPLPEAAWHAWKREPVITYAGMTFVQCPPLFTHQYPWCWFDVRGLRDDTMDYFLNSQLATLAQRHWMANELGRWKHYGADVWGLTASDYEGGYTAWGGPPQQGDVDGTVVPTAPGGSVVFEPRACVDALKALKSRYGEKAWRKYGFVDAFNPARDWYNADVIGIDVGPMVLMAENARTGFVWRTFMSSPEAKRAIERAGLRPHTAAERQQGRSSVGGQAGRPAR